MATLQQNLLCKKGERCGHHAQTFAEYVNAELNYFQAYASVHSLPLQRYKDYNHGPGVPRALSADARAAEAGEDVCVVCGKWGQVMATATGRTIA